MLVYKAYKFRMYPNNNQKELIDKTLGCNRFIYNYFLDRRIKEYKENKKSISLFDLIKEIRALYPEKPFLKEVDSTSFRCTLFDLDNAYKKFFKENTGFPKFKSKFDKNSYRTNLITSTYKGKIYENIKLDLESKLLTLPKIKEIKIRGYRKLKNINGRIINVTITREKTGKYYASVLFKQDIFVPKSIPTKVVGIDLGIKDLVITSSFEKYKNEKAIKKYEKRIKTLQKALSRKEYKSKNYFKTKQLLAKVYSKLQNARKYSIHYITKKITDENDIITVEHLKIQNMVKNHKLAKSITDASFYEITRQLEYKSKWKGKRLYKVDTFYPSSQICSKCGYQNKIVLDLNVREYSCPNCNSYLDRDINAAENIRLSA